ncbi:hypothetical protein RhiirC2_770023 [Rhizophagus irregularis]|uniref:Uncharacterized protein n=1 Tax=Rhizophagus irregularis TaxID=588596 RepID=A0A2N1NXN3_9GLOM|nr:hypothetical protein RhiirC2_770023 [Rhizophagus irregularis]
MEIGEFQPGTWKWKSVSILKRGKAILAWNLKLETDSGLEFENEDRLELENRDQ